MTSERFMKKHYGANGYVAKPDELTMEERIQRIAEKAFGARPNQSACIAAINEATADLQQQVATLKAERDGLKEMVADFGDSLNVTAAVVSKMQKELEAAEAKNQRLRALLIKSDDDNRPLKFELGDVAKVAEVALSAQQPKGGNR